MLIRCIFDTQLLACLNYSTLKVNKAFVDRHWTVENTNHEALFLPVRRGLCDAWAPLGPPCRSPGPSGLSRTDHWTSTSRLSGPAAPASPSDWGSQPCCGARAAGHPRGPGRRGSRRHSCWWTRWAPWIPGRREPRGRLGSPGWGTGGWCSSGTCHSSLGCRNHRRLCLVR